MSYDDNVYYNPEKYGLEVVGEINWIDECYEFDLSVVWKDAEGKYYWASDSGCSCPSPFEDFNSLDDLNSGSKQDAINFLESAKEGNESAASAVFELISKLVAP
jgi:hypothetical protein